MSEPVLTAGELLAWNEKTSNNWQKLLTTHPELLAVPCDVAGTKAVAQLLQHIVAVELRYAERLAALPVSDYANLPCDTVASIYATHERAAAIYRELLASDIDWEESMEYTTRSAGTLRSRRRTILIHALMHSIRHYAQLASLVRQHGVAPGWPMDYLFMDAERV
jgi:uncharacterized damage-inducible protein DinB